MQKESNLFDQTGELIRQEPRPMTWQEMKTFCEGLNEEQLKEDVVLWREEEGVASMTAELLGEDHYADPEGYVNGGEGGLVAESEIKDSIENYSDGEYSMKDFILVRKKGYPHLFENF